ncbi:MAG: PEGA domain-containing protein, partial [Candidatus Micrarchaeota archaeon]
MPTPTFSPTPSELPSPMPTPSISPSPAGSITPTPTATIEPTVLPEPSINATASPSASASPEPSINATISPSPSINATVSPSPEPQNGIFQLTQLNLMANAFYPANKNFGIHALLSKQSDGSPIESMQIELEVNSVAYASSITDGNGSANFTLNLSEGTYNLTAIFPRDENAFLNGSNATGTIIAISELNQTGNETNGTLFIESSPSLADIFIDGEYRNQTPANITNLTIGFHSLILNLTNYTEYSEPLFFINESTFLLANLTSIINEPSNESLNESELNATDLNFTELNMTEFNASKLRKKPTKFRVLSFGKKKSYKIGEEIVFRMTFQDDENRLIESGRFRVFLVAPDGNETEVSLRDFGNEKEFRLPATRALRPGYYYLKLVANFQKRSIVEREVPIDETEDPGMTANGKAASESSGSESSAGGDVPPASAPRTRIVREEVIEDIADEGEEDGFALGLVNINSDKGIYSPGETANITIGVLANEGYRIDSANVTAIITSPSGSIRTFSTMAGDIIDNSDGSYSLIYPVNEVGTYSVHAFAIRFDVDADSSTGFSVLSNYDFDIIRTAPTVMYPDAEKMHIMVIAKRAVTDAIFLEPVSSNLTLYPSSLNYTETNDTKIITWELGNMAAGETRLLEYTFLPPEVYPREYLFGPAKIFHSDGNFTEGRSWSVAVDDWGFILDFSFYHNMTATVGSSPYPWDPLTLCANQNYTLNLTIINLHSSADTSEPTYLQSSPGITFVNLPSNGFTFFNGDSNPHTMYLCDCDGNAAAQCADPRYGSQNTLYYFHTPNAVGSYNLRAYMIQRNGVVLYLSNRKAINIQNCTDIGLANRDIAVKGPDGTKDVLIAGSTNTITVPLFNYKVNSINNTNVTVNIYQGTTLQNWWFRDGNSKMVNFSASANGTNPSFSEKVVRFRLEIPDSADVALTYKAKINVTWATGSREFEHTFTLQPAPVVIYTSMTDYTSDTVDADANERLNQTITFCNYGDQIINATLREECPGSYACRASNLPNTYPAADLVSEGLIEWYNIILGPSECYSGQLMYYWADENPGSFNFIQTVIWDNDQQAVEEFRTLTQYSGDNPSPATVISTDGSVYSGNITLRRNATNHIYIYTRNWGGNGGVTNIRMLLPHLYLPPGFQRPFSFTNAVPLPGYPIGSVEEGWTVKFASFGELAEGGGTFTYDFYVNLSDSPDYIPGGKHIWQSVRGNVDSALPLQYRDDDIHFAAQVQGPYVKMVRSYYDTDASDWVEGFPTSLGCTTLNTSLKVLNKGNQNLWSFNVTELHPSSITTANYTPTPKQTGTNFITWGNTTAFNKSGIANVSFYNYSFTTPLGIYYQQIFEGTAVNGSGTANYYGQNYSVNLICTDTPLFENYSVTPGTSGFGFKKYFSVMVYSNFHNLTVNLTSSLDGSSNWTVLNSTYVVSQGQWALVNFTQSFSCDEVGSSYYNFTAYDTDGNVNTTPVNLQTVFTVSKDTLQFNLVFGNNSLSNRSGSNLALLGMRVNDTNGTYIGDLGINFSVTTDGSTYGPANLTPTNSSGYANLYFNATCSPTEYQSRPDQKWKATLAGSGCYNDISSDIYALQVKGFLNNNVTNPKGDTNFTEPAPILDQGNVRDDCGNYISPLEDPTIQVTFNHTDNTTHYSCAGTSLGGGFYECTLQTTNKFGGYYNVTMNATASKYYPAFFTKVGSDPWYLYYLFAKAKLTDWHSAPLSEGWGRQFNYSVNMTAPVYNVPVTGHLYFGTVSDPVQLTLETLPAQSCVGVNCANYTINWTRTFSCENPPGTSDVGTWFYKYLANTTEQINSETAVNSTVVEKDDVVVTHVSGNNTIANRSGEQHVRLVINVTDTDRNLMAGDPYSTVYFNVTTNGIANQSEGSNTTNASGTADFYFNATCNNSAGIQKWFAFTTSNTCYKDYLSKEYVLQVYGDFQFAISTSNGTGNDVVIGENVTFTLTTTDECNNIVANATAGFTAIGFYNTTYCGGANLVNYSNGTYSCTLNTSDLAPGYFNVRANATKEFYNGNATTAANVFRLLSPINTEPILLNITAYPDPAGWGEQLNFSAYVRDAENQNVLVTLSNGNASSGPFSYINETVCPNCLGNIINFTIDHTFTCSDIGMKFFIFNGTDELYANGSSEVGNWTIQRDNVSIYYVSGNNTNVTRNNGSTVLSLYAYDTDNRSMAYNGSAAIWVTTNGASFGNGNYSWTNSSGNFSIAFKPSCSYGAGTQLWRGGIASDGCFFDSNSTINYAINIIGALNVNISVPYGINVTPGQNVTIRGNLTDDCGNLVSGATVNFLVQDGAAPVLCPIVYDEGDGFYNCSLNTTSLSGGNYFVTMNGSKLYYGNKTAVLHDAFHMQTAPTLANPLANTSSVYWGGTILFNVTVSDKDDVVSVNLWEKNASGDEYVLIQTQICTNCSGQNMTFTDDTHSACTDFGTWTFKFNATDSTGETVQTTTGNFDLTRRDLIDIYQQGNESSVHRITNTTFLATRFVDSVDPTQYLASGVTATLFVTKDGTTYQVDGTNNTINGLASRRFDPTCTTAVGLQKWKFGVPQTNCYLTANSSVYNVTVITNQLNNNITRPLNGTCYVPGEQIIINGTVADECSGVALAVVAFTVGTGAGSSCGSTTNVYQGNYSCVWNSIGRNYGLYNVTLNSSKTDYYNGSNTTIHALRLSSVPMVYDPIIDIPAEGWGVNRTFNVTVLDLAGGDVNVSLWARAGGSSAWILRASQMCDSCSEARNLTFTDVYFTCSNLVSNATWEYKFNATVNLCYTFGNETATTTFSLQKDDINLSLDTYGTSVYRVGDSAIALSSRIFDLDRNVFVSSGANGTIWVTTSGGSYDGGNHTQTNTSGYINALFNPSCTYKAESHYWRAGVFNDVCYKTTNSSEAGFDVTGQAQVGLELPNRWDEYNVTNNILLRFNVTSECIDEEGFLNGSVTNITLTNEDTSDLTYCSPIENETIGYYNCTWPSSESMQGNYSVTINATAEYYNSNSTLYQNWFYLKNLLTNASDLNVSTIEAGWGSSFQFNVTIDDPEDESITCQLFTNTTGEWVYRGYGAVPLGQGNCSVTVDHFECGDISNESQFMFQIINGEPANTFNTSIGPLFNVTRDALTLALVAGDGSYVNRSGGNSTALIISAYDDDWGRYAPTASGITWITTDGVNFDDGNATSTNSSGHLEVLFNPSCSYSPGPQNWMAGISDSCYYDINTINYTATILGGLTNNFTYPYGPEVLRGANVTINATVIDDCNAPVADANVNISIRHNNSLTVYLCSGVTNSSPGNYTCYLNTSSYKAGAYNITMNSSKPYHNIEPSNAEYVPNLQGLWVETVPEFNGVVAIPQVGGWGETFTLLANITDEDNDTITVYAFIRQLSPSLGEYTFVQQVTKQGVNQSVNFTKTFSSADLGDWALMFNSTEDDVWNATSSEYNFSIERDDTRVDYYAGNYSTVSRLGTNYTTFITKVEDTDKPSNKVASEEAHVWWTNNSVFGTGAQVYTNGSGYINYNFNPGCDTGVGIQQWKAGLLNESGLYKPSNSTQFNVTITSEFYATLSAPLNVTYIKGVDNINLRANVTDSGGCGRVSGATVVMSPLDGVSCTGTDEQQGYYNCTIANTTTTTWAYGWYNVTINVSRSYYSNYSTMQNLSFYIASRPQLSSPSVTPGAEGWGAQFNFTVTTTDLDDNNVTVYLFKRKSGGNWTYLQEQTCGPCNAQELLFVQEFNNTDVGGSEYFFNATDVYGYNASTSPIAFTINRDAVSIDIETDPNILVDREGSDSIPLVLRVYDQTRSLYVDDGVNGTFFITVDGENYAPSINVTTNTSGHLAHYFDPDCTYAAMPQKWKGGVQNDAYYTSSLTSNFTVNVTGQLKNELLIPANGSEYNTSNLVPIRLNVTTDCEFEGSQASGNVIVQMQSPL